MSPEFRERSPQVLREKSEFLDTLHHMDVRSALASARVAFERYQDSNGLIAASPEARILETAICSLAVPRTHAVQWLLDAKSQMHDPLAFASDEFLRACAYGGERTLDLDPKMPSVEQYSNRALLLCAVARACGQKISDRTLVFADREKVVRRLKTDHEKPWTRVELASAALLFSAVRDEATAFALDVLVTTQGRDGSYFANPITTALAVLALVAHEREDVAAASRAYLADKQCPDGTWRFCMTEVWDTALAVRVLARDNPDAIAALLDAQNEDGGFPFARGAPSDTDTTGMAWIALARAGVLDRLKHSEAHYLRRKQIQDPNGPDDGLWLTWTSKSDRPAQDAVAHAMTAMRIAGEPPSSKANAAAWLERHREAGWRAAWYAGAPYVYHEIALALGFDHAVSIAAAADLLQTQNSDGGFALTPGGPSTPASTGMAIALLLRYHSPEDQVLHRALEALLSMQSPDGHFSGPSAMFGPRPFLSDYPVQTHAFATFGLSELVRRIDRSASHERRSARQRRQPRDFSK